MNRLADIIGKAPSELPLGDLLSKLEKERARISRILSRPQVSRTRAKPKKRKAKPKTTISEAQLRAIAEATGVPLVDLMRGGR